MKFVLASRRLAVASRHRCPLASTNSKSTTNNSNLKEKSFLTYN